jgi:hypothetical protein
MAYYFIQRGNYEDRYPFSLKDLNHVLEIKLQIRVNEEWFIRRKFLILI